MPFDQDSRPVSMNDAFDAWEPFAVELLTDTAKRYNGVVTYKQLGDAVQQRSGVRHNGLLTNWIGGLLARVIGHCERQQIPQISSLCVREDGTVGDGYRHAVVACGDSGALDLDQLDDHAAQMRLECYRHFGATLPLGGGEPALTPRAKAARQRRKRLAAELEPPKLCPSCNMVLPRTGKCDCA